VQVQQCIELTRTIETVGKGFLDNLSKVITVGEGTIEECFDETSYINDYEDFAFVDIVGLEKDYEEFV
jgi:hypothetical protein